MLGELMPSVGHRRGRHVRQDHHHRTSPPACWPKPGSTRSRDRRPAHRRRHQCAPPASGEVRWRGSHRREIRRLLSCCSRPWWRLVTNTSDAGHPDHDGRGLAGGRACMSLLHRPPFYGACRAIAWTTRKRAPRPRLSRCAARSPTASASADARTCAPATCASARRADALFDSLHPADRAGTRGRAPPPANGRRRAVTAEPAEAAQHSDAQRPGPRLRWAGSLGGGRRAIGRRAGEVRRACDGVHTSARREAAPNPELGAAGRTTTAITCASWRRMFAAASGPAVACRLPLRSSPRSLLPAKHAICWTTSCPGAGPMSDVLVLTEVSSGPPARQPHRHNADGRALARAQCARAAKVDPALVAHPREFQRSCRPCCD